MYVCSFVRVVDQEVDKFLELNDSILVAIESQHQILEVSEFASYLHFDKQLLELFGADGAILVRVEFVEDGSKDIFVALLVALREQSLSDDFDQIILAHVVVTANVAADVPAVLDHLDKEVSGLDAHGDIGVQINEVLL